MTQPRTKSSKKTSKKKSSKTGRKVATKKAKEIILIPLAFVIVGIRQTLHTDSIPEGPFAVASYGGNMDFWNFDFFKKHHDQVVGVGGPDGFMSRRTTKVGNKWVSELDSEPGSLLEEANAELEPLGFKVGSVHNGIDPNNSTSSCLDHMVDTMNDLIDS